MLFDEYNTTHNKGDLP